MNDPILIDLVISEPILLDLALAPEYYVGTAQAGPIGVQGVQGLQGVQGVQGVQGLQGVQGSVPITRVFTTTNNATAVINSDSYDEYYLTAMASNTTISIIGTPVNGQTIFIGLKDNGVSVALTWTGITSIGVTLPNFTSANKQHLIELKYINSAWKAIRVSVESLLDNLISCWELDETVAGLVIDSHGSNHGINYGATINQSGKIAQAYDFEASQLDYINIGNTPSLQLTGAMSISAWVNIESVISPGKIISKMGGSGGNRGWTLTTESTDVFSLHIASNPTTLKSLSTTQKPSDYFGQWLHIVGIYKPSTYMRIYLNGVQVAETTTSVPAVMNNPSVNVNIGTGPTGGSFDGLIDQVAIWNSVLTLEEIVHIYNSGNGREYPFTV